MVKKDNYNVAVAGATGAVGRKMLEILEERKFPVATLKALASAKSVGQTPVSYTHLTLPTNREV